MSNKSPETCSVPVFRLESGVAVVKGPQHFEDLVDTTINLLPGGLSVDPPEDHPHSRISSQPVVALIIFIAAVIAVVTTVAVTTLVVVVIVIVVAFIIALVTSVVCCCPTLTPPQ